MLTGFSFGTKAETLERLKPLLSKSNILDLVYFSKGTWQLDPVSCIDNALSSLSGNSFIIRSSAIGEDGVTASLAGQFISILDVPRNNRAGIIAAVEQVFSSTDGFNGITDDHQVLIQPMLPSISMSGVALTYDLVSGAPYYCIDYDDESGKTDTVTQGKQPSKSVLIWRNTSASRIHSPYLFMLLEALKELECICDRDPLDIEFAIGDKANIFILQVRRISTQGCWSRQVKSNVNSVIESSVDFLRHRNPQRKGVFGKKAVYGEMTDWNPSEMIGACPRPLAYSLYRNLITHSSWRTARAKMGYHHPVGEDLMVLLGSQPFIDVRNSFNSFLPAHLPSEVGEILVNAWLDRLCERPELHDKVEFDVTITCYDFAFMQTLDRLYPGLLGDSRSAIFTQALKALTEQAVNGEGEGALDLAQARIQQLAELQVGSTLKDYRSQEPYILLMTVLRLLEECRFLGTEPFAVIARHAFIAEAFLRSLGEREALAPERMEQFRASKKTIAGSVVNDMLAVGKGLLSRTTFLERYGHLRPGTYDIRSKRYDQMIDLFDHLDTELEHADPSLPFTLSDSEAQAVDLLIRESNMKFDHCSLFAYIDRAILAREYAKFIFSRHVSDVLELIAIWGRSLGLEREDVSYLDINDIYRLANESSYRRHIYKNSVKLLIERIKTAHAEKQGMRLGCLIRDEHDVFVVESYQNIPNFITSKKVRAPVIYLSGIEDSSAQVHGHIICIESADPGFDWLFSRGIVGLITKFGGSNSHMGIRCAEFSIPAAIGCGKYLFDRLVSTKLIELDCNNKSVHPWLMQ